MSYQDDLFDLGKKIFKCPYYTKDKGKDRCDCFDTTGAAYEHGPEMSFVGSQYGRPGLPRILFTRLNPVWDPDVGFMGTRESIKAYTGQDRDCPKEVFDAYLEGWTDSKDGKNRTYRGMRDAGTVTGHPSNKPVDNKTLEEWRGDPHFGIQVIMQQLRHVICPNAEDLDLLQYCAINNLVKCAGPEGSSANPSPEMYRNCFRYYWKELEILKPHIVVALGGDTDDHLSRLCSELLCGDLVLEEKMLKFDGPMLYFRLPHPLGQGLGKWEGKSTSGPFLLTSNPCRQPSKDVTQFTAGPGGKSRGLLFKHTLHLVCEAERLADYLRRMARRG